MSVQRGCSGQQRKQGQNKEIKTRPTAVTHYPVPIVHKDVYHRLNFMYQASIFLDALGAEETPIVMGRGSPSNGVSKRKDVDSRLTEESKSDLNCSNLAKEAMKSTFKTIAVHQTLRLDSSLKRSVCRSCGTVLIPNLTSLTRIRPSRNFEQVIHTTCLSCSSVSSLPAPPLKTQEYQAEAGNSVDGPVRAKRRRKARRSVPFNDREAIDGEKGHELWSTGGKVSRWSCCSHERLKDTGVIPSRRDEARVSQRGMSGGASKAISAPEMAVVKSAAVVVAVDDEEAMMNS